MKYHIQHLQGMELIFLNIHIKGDKKMLRVRMDRHGNITASMRWESLEAIWRWYPKQRAYCFPNDRVTK